MHQILSQTTGRPTATHHATLVVASNLCAVSLDSKFCEAWMRDVSGLSYGLNLIFEGLGVKENVTSIYYYYLYVGCVIAQLVQSPSQVNVVHHFFALPLRSRSDWGFTMPPQSKQRSSCSRQCQRLVAMPSMRRIWQKFRWPLIR